MDNVTHTLAGLLVAEAAVRLRERRAGRTPSGAFRTAAAIAGAVAANLPDVDVVAPLLGADRLQALLHHRGYTHTVVAAALGGLLTWVAALAVWRRRARGGAPPDAADRRWLLGVVAVAVASHLALDWTNDYGVHVWWPVDDRWAYGDAVFIVEPWLWVAAVPTLALAAGRRAVRVGLWLVLLAALALAWVVPFVGPGSAVAVTLGAGVGAWVARRLAPGRRAAFAVAGWLAVELSGFAGMRAARRQVADAVAAAPRPAGAPAPRLVDVVTTPTPGNPLCARVVAVETDGGRYRVTTAWAAALPGVVAASKCALPEAVVGVSTVPFRPSPRPSTAAVVWRRTWDAPLGELVALARENCVAAAFLRFARVPAWTPLGADSLVVGDLRYDREPGVGFSEFVVARRPAGCPRGVPPWRAPRAGLIGDR